MENSVRKLSFTLGAEVLGIDLRRPVGVPQFQLIRRAFLEHGLLLFRGQALDR